MTSKLIKESNPVQGRFYKVENDPPTSDIFQMVKAV